MNLTTTYLGLTLPHPFMPGASPMGDDLDMVMRLEDAGAAALVLRSLFAEQVRTERYLELIDRIKRRVRIPIIASLNGTTAEQWLNHARLIEKASVDALELNFYHVATDPFEDARSVEARVIDIVAVLKESIRIPLAVKLFPFYSALPNLAWQLTLIGTDGLVLFNRFSQAEIDPESLDPTPRLELSTSSELVTRLRWLEILFERIGCSLAISGGVHEATDAVKAILAGAHAVQVVSALLLRGPEHLVYLRREFERWGDEHGYESIDDMRGRLSLARSSEPHAFDRVRYMQLLQSWRPAPSASTLH